jgi:hypothetical protein
MLTYTLRLYGNYSNYLEQYDLKLSAFVVLSRDYYRNENGEDEELYVIYELERDGKHIPFHKDSKHRVQWRKVEEEEL